MVATTHDRILTIKHTMITVTSVDPPIITSYIINNKVHNERECALSKITTSKRSRRNCEALEPLLFHLTEMLPSKLLTLPNITEPWDRIREHSFRKARIPLHLY